ncbi:MAG: hypothetical protein IKC51_03010 [Myxococcaceae bacterium]|nr:hypothetical protein [Myxococcaceae bacterium]
MTTQARAGGQSGKRPELIATLGPASFGLAVEVTRAGATGLRLNASHISAAELARVVLTTRALLPKVPIVVDLQGGKLRLGEFAPREVRAGERVEFSWAPNTPGALPLPHPELFASARAGDILSIGDGQMRLRVLGVTPTRLTASALTSGELTPRKGVTPLDRPVDVTGLTQADLEQLAALPQPLEVSWALSFLKDGSEARALRERLPGVRVIGKIERQEAIDNIDRVAKAVDELWICRGDLGEQIDLLGMAEFVAGFDPRRLSIPVLMAGQVFEHLTEHETPTRSEICHLYDLVRRGYAGVVLSDETTIGRAPIEAVATARGLLDRFAAAF